MKSRLLLLLPILLFLVSCEDSNSDSAILEISPSTFNAIHADGETLKINITCNASWTASSNKQWCIPNKKQGNNNEELRLYASANLESAPREATVTIISKKTTKTIKIRQEASNRTGEYHYKLPVIFHVLYKDQTNSQQYVRKGRINELITACNKYYQNLLGSNSIDMNLEFVLATEDPQGNTLSEAGVERIPVTTPEQDCEAFMNSKANLKYLWDTDRYINIMLYTFKKDEDSEGTILGISHLPYTVAPNKLEGLNQLSSTPNHSSLKYPHCISINNTFIYSTQSNEILRTYNSADIVATISHELGHYLGLFHIFSESDANKDRVNVCEDTDYCDDTPTYDRASYSAWLMNYIDEKGGFNEMSFDDFNETLKREDCFRNQISTPNNIMDYDISWMNRFTFNQRERIRYVLSYSPLIPSPKAKNTTIRMASGPQDLPIRMIK